MPAPRKYPNELRERALRLVTEAMSEDPNLSLNGAVLRIGPRVGVVPDTLRGWAKAGPGRCRHDAGHDHLGRREAQGVGAGGEGAASRQRDPAGGVEFLRAGARPATALVVRFIAAHADRRSADGLRWGVEPICTVLSGHGVKIAPSTYYAARSRAPSARAVRDGELLGEIVRVHSDRNIGRGSTGRARCGTSCVGRAPWWRAARWSA